MWGGVQGYSGHLTLAKLANEAARQAASATLKDSAEAQKLPTSSEDMRIITEAALKVCAFLT